MGYINSLDFAPHLNRYLPMSAILSQKPVTQPKWWHVGGNKIKVHEMVLEGSERRVKLKSEWVTIVITPDMRNKNFWKLHWSIIHVGRGAEVNGDVTLSDTEMNEAFLRASTQGNEIGTAGYFCRLEEWLNIPNRGTGQDGDTNVSIRIGEHGNNVGWAVARLMQSNQA